MSTAVRERPERARRPAPPRRSSRSRSSIVPSWSPDVLLSAGKPLPTDVRASLERGSGQDLADVRVHDDAGSAELADAAGAAAFVLGAHVFFANGRYDPSSEPGRRLLAHEIAHIVQTRGASPAAPGEAIGCQEADADRLADALIEHGGNHRAGEPAPAPASGESSTPAAAAPAPAPQLPALRFVDAVSRGTTGTVAVVELVVRMIARTLRTDPDDRSGRIRAQLARLGAEQREDVLSRARDSMPASDFARLEAIVEHADPSGAALSTPAVGADPDDVAASEAAETAEAEHAEADQADGGGHDASAPHTHADGTTHSHGGGGAHSHGEGGAHSHDGDGGHEHAKESAGGGLFGRIAAALFGGSPLFAAIAGRAGSTAAGSTAAGSTAAAGQPAASAAPSAARAAPGAPTAAQPASDDQQGAAGPVSAEDEQLAEGRPAAVHPPAAPPAPADAAEQTAAPESPEALRIAEPEAGVAEVAAAAGAGGAPPAAAAGGEGAPMQADQGAAGLGASGAGAADQAEQAGPAGPPPSPEQQRQEDEDRTVLATHEHAVDAAASDVAEEATSAAEPAAPAAAGPTEAEGPVGADPMTAEPLGAESAAADSGATSPAGDPADLAPIEPVDAPAAPPGAEAAEPEAAGAPEGPEAAGAAEPEAAAPEAAPEAGAAEPAAADAGGEAAPEAVGAEAAAPEEAGAGPEAVAPDGAGPEAAGPDGGAEAEGGAEAAGPVAAGPEGAGPEGGAPGGAPGGLAGCMGGDNAQQPPAPEADGPAAGCGGGGGAAGGEAPPPPSAPDVSNSTPDEALATVGALPATDLQQAIPQVGAAATKDVTAQRDAMPPPTMDRPSGASAALDVSAPIPQRPTVPYTGPSEADKVSTPAGQPTPQPNLQPTPSPAAGQVPVVTPRLGGGQQLTEAEAARVTESIDAVPTTDPELAVDAGDPGAVALEADADPALVGQQRQALGTQISTVATQGAQDAAAPLGEANIRPHVPAKTLTAAASDSPCPGLSNANAAQKAANSKHPAVAVNAIVAERNRNDIQAGVTAAGAGFTAAREKRTADEAQARSDADAQMNDAVQQNNTEQVTLRRGAIARSTQLRGEWTQEQRTAVDTAVSTSDTAASTGTNDVARAKREHEATAQGHIDNGNKEIRGAREDAERKAREKKASARKEKSGILGWIGSKVASFFEGLKSAITGFFDLARSIVRKAIDGAKKLAHAAIELGRRAVVGAIKLAGDVIIAAGDVVLAAFPETRAKFREKVSEVVDTATQKVNEAADALEKGIQALLDGLGRALDCALQYLQAGYLAAVDLLASAVKAALDAAQAFLDTLAEWVAIIADIAGDPIGWLKGLGRSAIDGTRNCLFGALKRSIKQWFNDKVEEVVGVGKLILNILLKGCLSFADIARMAWDGIKAALPGIVVQLIIEKLVALIIPAGAALSLIIDGLKAAWGAAGRILAAFQKFMAFLKAVRGGNGPGAFADLVGAAAVAAIDFISNFLIDRLKGAGKGVGGALKGMAQRIGRTLGRVGRAVGRGARAVGRGVMRGVRAGAGMVRRGAAAVVRGGRRVLGAAAGAARRVGRMLPRGVVRAATKVARAVDPRRLARAIARSRMGRAFGRGVGRARAWAATQRDRLKARYQAWRARRKQKAAQSANDRLAKAATQIRPVVARTVDHGGSWLSLAPHRVALWAKYRASLRVDRSSTSAQFVVKVNPMERVGQGFVPTRMTLKGMVERASRRILDREETRAGSQQMADTAAGGGAPHVGGGLGGVPAAVRAETSGALPTPAPLGMQRWTMGNRNSGITEQRGEFAGPHEMVVRGPGHYTPPEAGGRNVAGSLAALGDDKTTAAAMRTLVQTGALPEQFSRNKARAGQMARIAHLLYTREGARRVSVAEAAMTVDLVASGRRTWRDALNVAGSRTAGPAGGFLPGSGEGAGVASNFLGHADNAERRRIWESRMPGTLRELGPEGREAARASIAKGGRAASPYLRTQVGPDGRPVRRWADLPADIKQLRADMKAVREKEMALAKDWLNLQMNMAGLEFFRDEAHAENFIYERLLSHYHVTETAAHAAGAA